MAEIKEVRDEGTDDPSEQGEPPPVGSLTTSGGTSASTAAIAEDLEGAAHGKISDLDYCFRNAKYYPAPNRAEYAAYLKDSHHGAIEAYFDEAAHFEAQGILDKLQNAPRG